MRQLGRFLQVVALFVVLPGAMVAQLASGLSVWQLLIALVAGAATFYLGRYIEGYAQP
jgi:hypothetical protein